MRAGAKREESIVKSEDSRRDNHAPRERISVLIAAIRRINATLDLDTVLGEVVESARDLTGARMGVLVILDEESVPQDPLFSGFTPEEEREQLSKALADSRGNKAQAARLLGMPRSTVFSKLRKHGMG